MLNSNLILILCLLGLTSLARAGDLSALQTAVHIAQDDMKKAKEERDADVQRVSAAKKELERQKIQLETARKNAFLSESRYLESKKKYDKAQAALDKAWKQ